MNQYNPNAKKKMEDEKMEDDNEEKEYDFECLDIPMNIDYEDYSYEVARNIHRKGENQYIELSALLNEAVAIDNSQCKQWYLEEIARILDVELEEHEAGIAP